ncbi:tripartite tricarboxylate transporter substrate binding protein [Salinicola peritrichatus]|uniref:tripartite tricarboxylate transporter substrate binding protein n=1 Tax=Salinicola peritrichatus TaxID=1267424 RepID=UPI000DA239C2|nr:tripartite tricarboxylate transporter substrate binding protein [Salinicola peritrichatus]
MKFSLRPLTAFAVAMVLSFNANAQEQDFSSVKVPSTIDVIVASSAGGSTDALARITMPYWKEAIQNLTGKDVATVIRNLPGAGTEIGATALATAEPDGATIGIINLPHIPLLQAARDVEFAPWLKAYTPLGVNVIDPNVIILGKRSKFDSLEQAIKAAKEEPGSVTVGAQGPLSDDHLALYALEEKTGAKFAFIPYAGGADASRAFLGGEIDITIGNVFDYVQVEDGAKDSAIFSNERSELIDNVPTLEEKIGVNVGEFGSTRAFAGPAGMAKETTALYRQALEEAFSNPQYIKEAKERNITLVEPRGGEELYQMMTELENVVQGQVQRFREAGYID